MYITYFSDKNQYVDRSVNSIWQCMKRIDTNLDYFAKIFNVELSPERKPAKMDDDEFLYLFPLTETDDVVDLESRLLDDCSDFKEKFVSYLTFFFIIILIIVTILGHYFSKIAQSVMIV